MNVRRLFALAAVALMLAPGTLALLTPATAASAPRTPDQAAPEPFFTAEPAFGTSATRFVVDPRGSNVPVGAALSLAWGDGAWTNATRTAQGYLWAHNGTLTGGLVPLNHTYASVGAKTIVLSLSHPTLGGAKSHAQVHVLALEPDARTRVEAARLRQAGLTPNNAVEIAQESAFGAAVPGTLVALVAGLEPDALPLNVSGNLLNLTYVVCSPQGCAKTGLENATDPDGASTSAFTVMLQKALNPGYVVVDVQGPDGAVELETLVHALEYAARYPADVVVSLLAPDTGFANPATPGSAYDPYSLLGSLAGVEEDHAHDAEAFWRAILANRARHDFGGDNHAYPPPNGFNDSAPLGFATDGHAHDHGGDDHDHHDHGDGYGESGTVYGSTVPGGGILPYEDQHDVCFPMPPAGPRLSPADFPALAGYQVLENATKDPSRLHAQDVGYLTAAERGALDLHLHHVLMHACLDLALTHLAHQGVPVVVPAGDDAAHQDADDPLRARWNLQTLADLAGHPQVITVGATSSDVAPYGPPYFGTQRIVLPTSGAGPSRSLYGVKPDLLAPADIPVPMLGNLSLEGAGSPARVYNLVENFTADTTRGTLVGNATLQGGRLKVGHDTRGGVVFTSSEILPPQPIVEADVRLERVFSAASSSKTKFFLAAQTGEAAIPRDGYGLEFVLSSANPAGCVSNCGGSVEITTHVWSAGREYFPCVGTTCVTPPTKANLPYGPSYRVRIYDLGEAAIAGHRVYAFEINKSGDAQPTRLLRDVKVDAQGRPCACKNLTFLSTYSSNFGNPSWAYVDNVFTAGLVEDAEAEYEPGLPVEGPIAVRPTTRVAAAYVGAVALLENFLLANEPDDVKRLQMLRGRLASQARPLDGVPAFVQGAGELNFDALPTSGLLGLLDHGFDAPGVDFGLQTAPGAKTTIGFHRPPTDALTTYSVSLDPSAATWHRVLPDGTHQIAAEKPSFSVNVGQVGPDAVNVTLTLAGLPALPGVYAASVPVVVLTGGALPNPFYRPLNLTLLVTRGVDYTLDVRGSGLAEGAQLWLLPHDHAAAGHDDAGHPAGLVHEPLLAGPSANATVEGGLARFGAVAPALYDLATPAAAGLPIPTTLGGHEAGRPRSFVVLARELLVSAGGVATAPQLQHRVPVAYRFLDLQQGADLAVRAVAPPATFDEGFRGTAEVKATEWNLRGDAARGEGHALDEPLPVGETPRGWDLRAIPRPPPYAIGDKDGADLRAAYEAHLDDATSFRYTALSGHLDPRPWLVDRDASPLPWVRVDTSFPVPAPTSDVHGVLVLPLQVENAAAMLRLEAGGREASYLVTPQGLWRPVSPDGLTWNVEADEDDDLPDANARGILSGFGHLHAPLKPRLGLFTPTPSGFLVPFSFHDLDSPAKLNVTLLLKPDPLGARALGATPFDPVPGSRFRLDGLGLYAWTRGEANLTGGTIKDLDARDLARFVRNVPQDPDHVPSLRVTPFASGAPLLGEFLEVYVRGPATGASAADPLGGNKKTAGVARHPALLEDAHALQNALGRALTPVASTRLHPEGVLDPYGVIDPRPAAGHVKRFAFAGPGPGMWRVEDDAIAAAGANGRFSVVFDAEGSAAQADLLVREPFPDFADVDRPPAAPDDRCLLAQVLAIVYAPYARQACLDAFTVYDDLLGAYDEYNASLALDAEVSKIGLTVDVAGGPGGACLDGGNETGAACTAGGLDLVEDLAGKLHLRAAFRGLGGGTGDATPRNITQRTPLWSGTVPATGALLVLRHRLDPAPNATATGLLEASVGGNPRPLLTLEGDETLTTAGAARGGWRTDVYDLAGYAGVETKIDAVPAGGWWTLEWRLLPRAEPAPMRRVDDTRYVVTDSPSTMVATIQEVPSGNGVVRVGPKEIVKAADSASKRVVATRGLLVEDDRTITGKHLVVGGDAGEGGLIRVTKEGHLHLTDVVLSPRSPRHPWSIVVEPGGRIDLANVTLLRGGGPAGDLAGIQVDGTALLSDVHVLGGAIGIRVGPTGTLEAYDSAFARLSRAIVAEGGRVALHRALVDGNDVGVLARNATVEIVNSTLTANRDAAILAQDSLIALTGNTFAWNGEAGPRAAIMPVEGLDTGRVLVHGGRMLHNARALDARADADLHGVQIRQDAATALAVRPAARLRLEAADVAVARGAAVLADAGATLEAANSTLSGAPDWLLCAKAGKPAALFVRDTRLTGGVESDCGATLPSGTPAANDPAAWRGLAFRPFLRPGDNDLLVVPPWEARAVGVVNRLGGATAAITPDAKLRLSGDDGPVLLETTAASLAALPGAWRTPAALDGTPPQSSETKLEAEVRRGFTSALSVPFRYANLTEPLAASDLWLSTVTADGRVATQPVRVLEDARGARAVLGPGAIGSMPLVTGEKVQVQPLLKDRAGNAAWGAVTSVVFDRTPPRAWIHAENPCGELLGHDLRWRGHDPMVGSGLPLPEEGVSYVVYVAALNLTALKDGLGTQSLDKLRTANPQQVNALTMERLDRLLPRLVDTVDPWNLLPLWVEIGRFNRTVEGIDWRPVDWETFRDVNGLANDTAAQLWNAKDALNASLSKIADDLQKNVTKAPSLTPLTKTLDELLTGALDNVQKMNPIVLAVKVEAFDAVGNKGVAIEPVLADAFAPTPLLYFLGDTVRERLAPLVLGPSARVSLSDRHAELALFDPDCGIELVEVLSGALGDVQTPIAKVYPKEGRVEVRVEDVGRFHAANPATAGVCGWRDMTFVAKDRHGRTTSVPAWGLIDRVAPLTTLDKIRPVLLPQPLPLFGNLPQPQLEEGKWIGLGGIEVNATAKSLNEGACAPSAIHDTHVQARLPGGPWASLLRVHHGSLQAAAPGVHANATVWTNRTFDFTPAKLETSDLNLSGREVSLRVLSTDEAGNDETSNPDVRTFRVDRRPPLCTLQSVPGLGGRNLPVSWSAQDDDQPVAGNVSGAYLVYRAPNSTFVPWLVNNVSQWTVFAPLPGASGSATVSVQNTTFTFPVSVDLWSHVQVACLAYDAAGNGRIGTASATNITLDLGLPWITLPALPDFSRPSLELNWSSGDNLTGLQWVRVYTGPEGGELTLRSESASGSLVLHPGATSADDGKAWRVRVEAQDKVGNVHSAEVNTTLDLTAPSCSWGGIDQIVASLGEFLPHANHTFTTACDNLGGGKQSPLDVSLGVTGTLARDFQPLPGSSPAAPKFNVSSLPGGSYLGTLRACDQAGNCQDPFPTLAFKLDFKAPTTTLLLVENGTAPTTLHKGAGVHWVRDPVSATFSVLDAQEPHGASGVDRLVVHARRMVPDPLGPTGPALNATAYAIGVNGSATIFQATFSGEDFDPNTLYRYEVRAYDRSGNIENVSVHWPRNVTTDYFAWDNVAPSATLDALPAYVRMAADQATATLPLTGGFSDVSGGFDSGVAKLLLNTTIGGGPTLTTEHAPTGPPYRIDATLLKTDDGLHHEYCVRAVDGSGLVGRCIQPRSTLLDATPPAVELVLPPDVGGADVWTNRSPVNLTLRVTNAAPDGRDASPLARSVLDADGAGRALHATDLSASLAGPGGLVEVNLSLDSPDGTVHALRAYARDAAGNDPWGAPATALANRKLGEEALYPFDARDGNRDASGKGHSQLTASSSDATPASAATPWDAGRRFDGGDHLRLADALNLGTAFTAMAWVKPDAAGAAPVFGKGSVSDDWGLGIDASNRPYATVRTSGGAATALGAPISAAGKWVHLALVYDGAQVRVLVDGQVAGAASQGGSVLESVTGFYLGRGAPGAPNLAGLLDEVRVHRRALAPADVDEIRLNPYETSLVPAATVHLDLSAPKAVPVVDGAFQLASLVRVHAYDPANGTPSALDAVALQARQLDGASAWGDVALPRALAGGPLGASNVPAGASVTATRTLHLPGPPRALILNVSVDDNVENGPTTDCNGNPFPPDAATWTVLVNGQAVLGGDAVLDEPGVHTVTLGNTFAWPIQIGLRVTNGQAWTAGCGHPYAIRFDDLNVRDATTLTALFSEDFTSWQDWTLAGATGTMRLAPEAGGEPWTYVNMPGLRFNASWPAADNDGFAFRGGQDALTSVTHDAGPGGSFSLGLRHAADGAGLTSQPVEVLEKSFPAATADTLLVSARAAATATGLGASLTARMGVSVTLDTGKTLVFVLHNESHAAAPPAGTHLVDHPIPEGAWTHLELDLAAAMQAHGLSGKPARVGLHLEKEGQSIVGASFEATLAVDDVRILDDKGRTRIDLPFAFPFAGRTWRTLWADEDGVIGVNATFSDAPTAANFQSGRFIAPAWGAFTRRGADATTAAHGVTLDARHPDQVTLTWRVGTETDPAQTHEFAATLTRTGEILFRYGSRFPDPSAVAIVGVSDGATTLQHATMPAAFAGRADGIVPAGAWTDLVLASTTGAATLPALNVPFHLRALATDKAGNQDPYRAAPEAVVTVDTLAPLLLLAPVLNPEGTGFLDRNLSVRTSVLDEGSGVDGDTVRLRIKDNATGTWTDLAATPGDGVVTATGYVLQHRNRYTLELTAKDNVGNANTTTAWFEAVIVPEPAFDLVRGLVNGTFVDDELVGVAQGLAGKVVGDRLSVKGKASANGTAMTFTLRLDGKLVKTSAEPISIMDTTIDVANLTPGLHYLEMRAETSAGSVTVQNYTFQVRASDVIAYSGLESQESAWTFAGAPNAERSERIEFAKRNGTWGARVNATAATGTPQASYALPEAVGTGRFWAFVRLNGTPTGGMDVLRLDNGTTTVFALRVEGDLRVTAYNGSAWHETGLAVLDRSWSKVEVRLDGEDAFVYVDNAYGGAHRRALAGAVTHLRFGAAADGTVGEFYIDDVAVALGDVITRTLLRDDFNADVTGRWVKEGTGTATRGTDPVGGTALRLNGATSPVAYRNATPPTLPDFSVSLHVGRFTGACGEDGRVLRLSDAANATLLALRCNGTALEALDATGGWTRLNGTLSDNAYDRLRVYVGAESNTVFLNEVLVGAPAPLPAGPMTNLTIGGGTSNLWFDAVRVERGRVHVTDGYERPLHKAWTTPPAGDSNFNATLTAERALTGRQSIRLQSNGTSGVSGTLNRSIVTPDVFLLEQWVYVPPATQAQFEEFYPMLLHDGTNLVLGIGLLTIGDGVTEPIIHKWGFYGSAGMQVQTDATPGWHRIGIKVDQASKTYAYVIDDSERTQQSYTAGRFSRIVMGDVLTGSFPTSYTGKGLVYVDDLVMRGYNSRPILSNPTTSGPDANGILRVSGTISDPDFGDGPERLVVRALDSTSQQTLPPTLIAKGPAWTYDWNVSALPSGTHRLIVSVHEGPDADSKTVIYVKP